MEGSILNNLGFDPVYLLIASAILTLILMVVTILCLINMRKLYRRYDIFMRGKDAVSLEKAFAQRFQEVDKLSELTKINTDEIRRIKEIQSRTANKIGIVKYDAFPDVGGRLSFALAMLDESNSGFVLNAIHGREGCYTYVKEIVKGESYIVLGQEEKEALRQAVNYFSDMG